MTTKLACVFNWFSSNYFKTNPKKSCFLPTSDEEVNLNLHEFIIKKSESQKLFCAISSHLMNTFLNYVEKQAKNYMLFYVFQVM